MRLINSFLRDQRLSTPAMIAIVLATFVRARLVVIGVRGFVRTAGVLRVRFTMGRVCRNLHRRAKADDLPDQKDRQQQSRN